VQRSPCKARPPSTAPTLVPGRVRGLLGPFGSGLSGGARARVPQPRGRPYGARRERARCRCGAAATSASAEPPPRSCLTTRPQPSWRGSSRTFTRCAFVKVTRAEAYNGGFGGDRGEDPALKDNIGSYAWTVAFANAMGDVPLLYPSGRLTAPSPTCAGPSRRPPSSRARPPYWSTTAPTRRT
jgi:hypothetical protein